MLIKTLLISLLFFGVSFCAVLGATRKVKALIKRGRMQEAVLLVDMTNNTWIIVRNVSAAFSFVLTIVWIIQL